MPLILVSIPEFLEYFSVSPQVRIAKASTAAVRMSLDLLQLEMGMEENASEPIDDKNNSLNVCHWRIKVVEKY